MSDSGFVYVGRTWAEPAGYHDQAGPITDPGNWRSQTGEAVRI